MTTILVARHGNTFNPGDVAVRVGIKTNLHLSTSGLEQARILGLYLKQYKIHPAAIFTSELIRTQETATIALATAEINIAPQIKDMFNEIDYGPDEGKTYEEIVARIGSKALQDWDNMAFVPQDWIADVEQIVQNWRTFANEMLIKYPNQTVLVFTSNGVARFAPYITNHFFTFNQIHQIKLATGAIGSLSYRAGDWVIDYWNERPEVDVV